MKSLTSVLPLLLLLPLWGRGGGVGYASEPSPEGIEFFEKKIRPVLAENCYRCHNSRDTRKGDIALDYRAAMLESGVIVPGAPEQSRLVGAMRHADGYEPMPFQAPQLANLIVKSFEEWVRMGAPDPRTHKPTREELAREIDWNEVRDRRAAWWSFQPIRRPAPPAVDAPEWERSAIDRFIYGALRRAGLSPVSPASPEALVRRLHLVLIGLPPQPEVVAAFAASPSRAAYEALVDELLASPQFGERWGRYWLDWFRFAESHGSEGDPEVPYAEVYRDYIIRALNEDVPYDQLIREHIAGDLLEHPRVNEELGRNESAVGPAHFRMVPHGFGVTDAYEEQITFTDNQIDVVSKAILGTTLSCARCHNHKFDPISQEDFYKFYGIMVSSRPGIVNVDSDALKEKNRAELRELKPAIRRGLAEHFSTQIDRALAIVDDATAQDDTAATLKKAAEETETHPLFAWFTLRDKKPEVLRRQWKVLAERHRERVEENSRRIAGATFYADLRDQATYERWFRNGTGLADQVSRAGAFAVAAEGDSALTGIYPRGVYTHLLTDKDNATLSSVFHKASGAYTAIRGVGRAAAARFSARSYPLTHGLHRVPDLPPTMSWIELGKYGYWNDEQVFYLLTTGPDRVARPRFGRSWFGVTEVYAGDEALHELGTPAAALPGDHAAVRDRGSLLEFYRRALAESIAAWRRGNPSDAQAELLETFRRHGLLGDRLDELPGVLEALVMRYRALEGEIRFPVRAPGVVEAEPWEQPLLVRGDYKQEAHRVKRGFLEVFGGRTYEGAGSGRRALAEDLLARENPLTARVIVNRLWHHTFGRGLVASADNFGRLGKTPSHPELLDWLASTLREKDDWSLKRMLRRLVTSRAFRSSSQPSPGGAEKDPDNLLLSHYTPRRLDAEAILDTVQFLAGTLKERAIYRTARRNALDPFLTAFNLPIPTSTVGVRDSTNVPAQSLLLMNGEIARRAAEDWAERISHDKRWRSRRDRIGRIFLEAFSRPPSAEELGACVEFLAVEPDDHALEELAEAHAGAVRGLAALKDERRGLLAPVRERLVRAAEVGGGDGQGGDFAPRPIAHWDFEQGLEDLVGSMHGQAHGRAHLEGGALVLEGGCVLTAPLSRDLDAKTLDVVVQLDRLDQEAGGAMTLQSLDGEVFDAIVYAEITPREWLAGSNNHRRTEPFRGPADDDADQRPVRVTIVFRADGTTLAYRDGKPYGEPFRAEAAQRFLAGGAQVGFGIRHGTRPEDELVLTGRVFEARLYDRALTATEVASGQREWIADQQVYDALAADLRVRVEGLDRSIASARSEEAELSRRLAEARAARGRAPRGLARLTHAILNSKELIYVH